MATAQSDLERQLGELGFEPARRGKHVIVRHPTAGSFPVPSTVGRGRSSANVLATAKRLVRQSQGNAGHFIDWLCEGYDVPRDGKKRVRLNVSDEIRNFIAREPGGERINALSLMSVARTHPRVLIIPQPRGSGHSVWEITGKDYVEGVEGVEGVQEEYVVEAPKAPKDPIDLAEAGGAARQDLGQALTEAVDRLERQSEMQSKLEVIVTSMKEQRRQLDDLISLLEGR